VARGPHVQDDGWVLRQGIVWDKPNAMPEKATDRCTNSHEFIFLLSKAKNYYFDHEAMLRAVCQTTLGLDDHHADKVIEDAMPCPKASRSSRASPIGFAG
jgi:hypothetical protein